MTHHNIPTEPVNSAFTGVIGVSQLDITPPNGIYVGNWGASIYDRAEGIHRPLKLTCITFQMASKEKPLVLISADLGWWKNKVDEWFVRRRILENLFLGSPQLMFCLSHTHSGPSLYRADSYKPGGDLIEPYLLKVVNTAVKAVKDALSKATTATLTWQYGQCNLATNRDLSLNESKRILVGFNPKQPADDTLLVGRVTDNQNDSHIIATIINYACHPTTLAWDNRLISPDYIGAMREIVELNTAAPCLFLQGASGDLAPAEQYVGDPSIADKNGLQLGYAVLSTLNSMLPPKTTLSFDSIKESGAPLAIWKRKKYKPENILSSERIEVSLPLKLLPSLTDIEKQLSACHDKALRERLWRLRGIRKSIGDGDNINIPLWVWQLGDSFLVGQPNETYSIFQQKLRLHLRPKNIAVINIVNGWFGYLPPSEFYNKDMYSVWQTPFAQGSMEILLEAAIKTIDIKL